MIKALLLLSAALYWACFAARAYLWERDLTSAESRVALLEKASLLAFTAGLVAYIGQLEIVNGRVHSSEFDLPVSLLLFAWSVSAANLTTEIAYGNRYSGLFANFWTALSLTSGAVPGAFHRIFTDDLQWLGFHRLCFLMGYAFLLLAFPLALRFVVLHWRKGPNTGALAERRQGQLQALDRMGYRMVLWALPLLTAGIITEALLLLETNRLPSPEQLLEGRSETLLALAAWFLCGIYLHSRLFLGWKHRRAAGLYIAGSILLIAGHLTLSWQNAT